jgi:tetratricopeptide (TPR) repeat protein
MYMTLFTGALALTMQELRTIPAFPFSGIIFGLAALTRPEAVGAFGVCWLYAALFRLAPFRVLAQLAMGFLVVFLPHFGFRLFYYGYPLPNTFYAKTSASSAMLLDGLEYMGQFLLYHGGWTLPALAGLWFGLSRKEATYRCLPAVILGAVGGYIILVGGDFYPFFPLLLCAGAYQLGGQLDGRTDRSTLPISRSMALLLFVGLSMALPAKLWPDLHWREVLLEYGETTKTLESLGNWLRTNRPPETVIAISSLGRVPYFSKLRTIDMLGLADIQIAHKEMELARGVLGHQKYDSEYILERKPDIVLLELGTREADFDPRVDLHTEKIYQHTLPSKGWWPAPSDLFGRREFRLAYTPRIAKVEPGLFYFFFERDSALTDLVASISEQTRDPRKLFELAMLYRRQGLLSEAVATMRRVAELDPSKVGPQLNIAYFLYEKRHYSASLDEFHELTEKFPNEAQITYGIALNLQKMERYTEAVPYWRLFLQTVPNTPFAAKARTMLHEAEVRSRGAAR